jgi:biotin carboxylase
MDNTEIWLIAVTAGKWQKHGIKEAMDSGIKVLAIDADPHAEGLSSADKSLYLSLDDIDLVIDELKKLKLNFQGTVSFCSEAGMTLAARIREEFSLPGPGLELTKRLLDKGVQRTLWSEKLVPGPEWKIFSDVKSATEYLLNIPLPRIIKPTDSSGSRGVTKIEQDADVASAVSKAFQFSRSGKVIVESFMAGIEFTVEVFVVAGEVNVLAVTEKKKVEGTRGTVARELATPERPSEVIEKISQTVINAFEALGYKEGPGHAEVILCEDDFVGMVEVAGRGGGFMVFNNFVPAVSGVNIAKLTAMQSVGLPIEKFVIEKNAAVLRFFPSRPGILRSISGFSEANEIVGVESGYFVSIGDQFMAATADGDRLGYILSCAASPALAQQLADQAESYISFEIQ